MCLNRILGSTTKINVLSVLISNPKRGFMEIELAKESGCSVSEVNRRMKELMSSGQVVAERGKVRRMMDDMIQFINAEISIRYSVAVYPIVLSDEEDVIGLSRGKSLQPSWGYFDFL